MEMAQTENSSTCIREEAETEEEREREEKGRKKK